MIYDYLFLTLKRAPAAQQALADQLKAAVLPSGEVVGQFVPQLGWAGNEAAVLVRWADGRDGDLDPITGGYIVAGSQATRLTPTVRPVGAALPLAGGIYVHRWFEVETAATDEFVTLSGQGWAHFETLFDAKIYGLFKGEPNAAQRQAGVTPLLLLTRYGSHGVWEASRDPTTEAMQIFARRQQLTRRSWAASTRLI
jgi:hypothetical protein